jgi:hypothetical protein
MQIFASFTIFFVLLPYLSPFPLGSDVQPIAGLMCFLWLMVNKRSVKLQPFDLALLAFCLLYTVNFDRTGGEITALSFRKHVNLLYIFPIYLFAKNLQTFKVSTIDIALFLILVIGIVQIISPGLYEITAGQVIRLKRAEFEGRGISSLAPEPTDMGFTMFYTFVLLKILAAKCKSERSFAVEKCMTVAVALLTFSGSSVFSFFFAKLGSIRTSLRTVFYSIVATLVLVFALGVAVEQFATEIPRPFLMLNALFSSPLVLVGSTSLGYRVAHFWLGFSSVFTSDFYFIGSGIGSLQQLGTELLEKSGIMNFIPFTEQYAAAVRDSVNGVQLSSSAGQLMFEMGFLGLAGVLALLYKSYSLGCLYSNEIGRLSLIAFALFLFQSFPLSYPLPWFVLGILSNRNLVVVGSIWRLGSLGRRPKIAKQAELLEAPAIKSKRM